MVGYNSHTQDNGNSTKEIFEIMDKVTGRAHTSLDIERAYMIAFAFQKKNTDSQHSVFRFTEYYAIE